MNESSAFEYICYRSNCLHMVEELSEAFTKGLPNDESVAKWLDKNISL